jgi:hypothetical protein
MNIETFKKHYKKAMEIANLNRDEVLLKDISATLKVHETKAINNSDLYIHVTEFEKSNGDKIYTLLVDYLSLLPLNDYEIDCHIYNALSYIKTTYITTNGIMQSLTYLTLLKEANLIDVLHIKYNRYHKDLAFVYNEVDGINFNIIEMHQLLMINDNSFRFNSLYDLSFKEMNIEEFTYIIVSEFYELGTNFDDLISIFKNLFIYFNYKLFKDDEAFKLLLKSYDHDYNSKYRTSSIKPYDFILLVDSFLTNEITLNDFVFYLMDYFNVSINKDKKDINAKLNLKEFHYSSGDYKFEI